MVVVNVKRDEFEHSLAIKYDTNIRYIRMKVIMIRNPG